MFGRKKADGSSPAVEERPGAKNRPTPKRSVAEAANKRPLVPNDRKVAGKASREQLREQRLRQRQAMLSGDERALPARDAGAVRRYVRDYVDARYSVGEFLLPLVVIVFVLTLTRQAYLALPAIVVTYGMVLAFLLDAMYLRYRLRKLLTAKFGSVERGVMFYAVTRALQLRRWRMPRPKVRRGEFPS
jgi:Protein of unknown function (DUF3043)